MVFAELQVFRGFALQQRGGDAGFDEGRGVAASLLERCKRDGFSQECRLFAAAPLQQKRSGSRQIRVPRKRNALPMTDTDDRLIANAAIIGFISTPNNGYSTPAASGMPSTL